LYLPLRESSNKAKIEIHSRTDAQIVRVSEWHAERFIDGPATLSIAMMKANSTRE
jgi:hypothetical protein